MAPLLSKKSTRHTANKWPPTQKTGNKAKTLQKDIEDAAMGTVKFESAEEAWFWFVAAWQAREEGARPISGAAKIPRPCEPYDILRIADRLYRNRRLIRDHLVVMHRYGLRHKTPDQHNPRQAKDHTIWIEAMQILSESLMVRDLVERPKIRSFREMVNQDGNIRHIPGPLSKNIASNFVYQESGKSS